MTSPRPADTIDARRDGRLTSRLRRATARVVLLLSTCAIPASGVAATAAEAEGGRRLCRFPDGEQRVVTQQVAASFGLSVSECIAPPQVAVLGPESTDTPWAEAPAAALAPVEAWSPASRTWTSDTYIPVSVVTLRAELSRASYAGSGAPAEYQDLIAVSARSHGVDPQMVEAVMYVESHFEPRAQSNKGALGLMQLMPQTARQCGVESRVRLFDPATNIDCGTRLLGELMAYFAGRVDLALAAYNAGPGAVVRHGWRVPPFAETQAYVERVLYRFNAPR